MRAALEERFGTTDRAGIAEIVFADRAELEWLEQLLHPRVRPNTGLARASTTGRCRGGRDPAALRDRGRGAVRRVVVVTAPEGSAPRPARGGARQRSARLIPDDEKVRRADYAYVNDGSLAELEAFVAHVLEELRVGERRAGSCSWSPSRSSRPAPPSCSG